jgi:hypothetical protein
MDSCIVSGEVHRMLARTALVFVAAVAVAVHSMATNKPLHPGEVMQVAALQHHVVVMYPLDEEELA